MKKIRIGIDASGILLGGGITHLKEIINNFDPKLFNIEKIVIWGAKKTLEDIQERECLKLIIQNDSESTYFRRVLWQIKSKRFLKQQKCDILFVPGAFYFGTFSPFITMSHNLLPFEEYERKYYFPSYNYYRLVILKWIQIITFVRAKGVIFLTNYAKNKILNSYKVKCSTVTISHGISNPFKDLHDLQENCDKNGTNKVSIVYISSLDHYKHQIEVVKAIEKVIEKGYSVELLLIGPIVNNKYYHELKKIIESNLLFRNNVKYLGVKKHYELAAIIKKCNIFLFASSCENQSIILLEGMGSGVPICCSNRNPMPEILKNGGIYFNPEDVIDIADAVIRLINSNDLRVEITKKALDITSEFTWEKCSRETFEYISSLAENNG